MNVLMFGMSSYPGGIESYIVNTFCNGTVAEKLHIDFVTYEDHLAYEDIIGKYGYGIVRVPHLKKRPLGYRKAVKAAMKKTQYDCVYVNMLTAANALPVKLAKQMNITNIVLHAHANQTISGFVRRLLHYKNRRMCNRAASMRLACSQEAAQWLFDEKMPDSPIRILPNAIDTDRLCFSVEARARIRAQYGIEDNTLLLGSVGRFGPEKNNLFMLDVLKDLVDKGVDAKLLLIGEGVMKNALQEKTQDYKLHQRVIFAGTQMETQAYYSAVDVFLFPSVFEGFGMSALEAQSCGLPCLCSDRLSKELDVTNTLCYLPIDKGAPIWSEAVLHSWAQERDALAMNQCVAQSAYCVKTQNREVLQIMLEQ